MTLLGLLIAIPGIILLNQEWQIVQTNAQISYIEVAGRPLSITFVMRTSLIAGTCLIVGGDTFARFAVTNQRSNKNSAV